MFIPMADDTQVLRDASDGLGDADNTARSEGTATDGARGPETEAAEAGAP